MVEPVLPECHVDTNLIETLVPPNTRYNHQHGCTEVAKRMKTNYKEGFALGIIDKDKRDIDYLKEFEKIKEVENELILWKHKEKHHYLIQICPAIESWILRRATEMNINLEDFGLKNTLSELRDFTKNVTSQKDERLKKVFRMMKNGDNMVVATLKGWIINLKENKFKVDIDKL